MTWPLMVDPGRLRVRIHHLPGRLRIDGALWINTALQAGSRHPGSRDAQPPIRLPMVTRVTGPPINEKEHKWE